MIKRKELREIIFEAETLAGKRFDIVLLWAILFSVLTVMLESVESLRLTYGPYFMAIEWGFTDLFSLEYLARIYTVEKPLKYIFSFYGIVDLLAIIPSFLGLFISGTHALSVVRTLRLLRVFRVLKLGQFLKESDSLLGAFRAARQKIVVFLFAVLMFTVILGTLMYIVESKEAGFTSIPRSIYWAIVTLTTVGYGDIAPQTVLGQLIASMIMIIGYGMIAVPTGIVGAEIGKSRQEEKSLAVKNCKSCEAKITQVQSNFCSNCGSRL